MPLYISKNTGTTKELNAYINEESRKRKNIEVTMEIKKRIRSTSLTTAT